MQLEVRRPAPPQSRGGYLFHAQASPEAMARLLWACLLRGAPGAYAEHQDASQLIAAQQVLEELATAKALRVEVSIQGSRLEVRRVAA